MKRIPGAVLLLVAAIGLFVAAWPYRDAPARHVANRTMHRPLAAAHSWHYQLDNIDIDKLAAVDADVLVVDFAKQEGKVPLLPAEVERLKVKPDGSRRFVIAYLSVGEGEEFRSYWQADWKASPPDWVGEENCAWPQAHRIHYWLEGWKKINFRGPQSYLGRIIAAGFDGVYLDRVDIYETFEKERPSARDDMITHVAQLAESARRMKPGFLVIPQNAEALLSDERYRVMIDGLGKESLLNGAVETGQRNSARDIRWSASLLNLLVRDGKPVLAVEYLTEKQQMAAAAHELRSMGLVPTFQTRALDGGDPTAPINLAAEIGTPERTTKECPPGTSW